MIKIKNYVKADNLDEAYALYQKKSNVILGGMLWLKMQKKSVGTAIDLCNLGLDKIEETENEFRIGAMATLRDLEKHSGLNMLTQGALSDSVKNIVGVQFRNLATVGGSVFSKFGFSDVLTVLAGIGAEIQLHKAGRISIDEFIAMPPVRDILVNIIIPKKEIKVCYLSQRNISTDFPVLTCAVCCKDGKYRIAVGARPHKAEIIALDSVGESTPEFIAEKLSFGSNLRASAKYRKEICKVLVKRALSEVR